MRPLVPILTLLLFAAAPLAGEIPGLPSPAPPYLPGDLRVDWVNDFMGRGGETDDYRTQQLIVSARLSRRWFLVYDRSILTYLGEDPYAPDPPGSEGRLDQLSGSLGYRLYDRPLAGGGLRTELSLGAGLRWAGNFQGACIQNGFHRLVGSEIEDLPYVDTKDRDLVLWLLARHMIPLFPRDAADEALPPVGWWGGGWFDLRSLVTTGGQWDGTLGAYGFAARRPLSLWLGLRGDWREGHDQDIVQAATAANEQGFFGVCGLSLGPLLLETVQGFGDEGAFGRMLWSAGAEQVQPLAARLGAFSLQVGLVSPDIAVQGAGRWYPAAWHGWPAEDVLLGLALDLRYGEPPHEGSTERFLRGVQASGGGELLWRPGFLPAWVKPYAGLGLGWRAERLLGDGALWGNVSERVGGVIVQGDLGLSCDAAGDRDHWQLQLRLGLTGILPLDKETVEFDDEEFQLLKPSGGILIGIEYVQRFG